MNTAMRRLRPLMLGGTGSDVGKSMLAAGLCRIFRQDGYAPAPFKAQNMALNSYATPEGFEIGRAQAVQAEAAGIDCHTDMNPLLLKPQGDSTCQIVVDGVAAGTYSSARLYDSEVRAELRGGVCKAFDRLSSRYNPIVMEGAGSVAEINLRESDIVNMPMAAYADAAVLLVADIDRGGVFASAYGSVMLQPPEYRRLIKGIIVNKFRGDMRLFDSGRRMLEECCGVPVVGVVPYMADIHIEDEDSVVLGGKRVAPMPGAVNVAVVRLPHISNFTDFNVLEHTPGVNVYYTAEAEALVGADMIVIPGTKTTISDLRWLKATGMDEAITGLAADGLPVVGICGGYQMMGRVIDDPEGYEGETDCVDGLGLLPVTTVISADKQTRRIAFEMTTDAGACIVGNGYEIHMGRTRLDQDAIALSMLSDGTADGCRNGNCYGTYIHGFLDNSEVIAWLLPRLSGCVADYGAYRQRQYDTLAARLRECLDMNMIYRMISYDRGTR